MISTQPSRARHSLEFLVRRWADLYRRRFYQLALFEIRSALAGHPNQPIARFLEGQTLLALNRPEEARALFDLLQEPSRGDSTAEPAIAAMEEHLPEVVTRMDEAMKSNPHLAAPSEPFGWLEDATQIGKGAVAAAATGGILGSSHIPGSLIEPIDIFPDREQVLRQVANQAAEDAQRLAREVIDAAEQADLPLSKEWEEAINTAQGTETIPSPAKEGKPALGPPAIGVPPSNRDQLPAPQVTSPPARTARDAAWEEWKREFEALVRAEKTHQALSHVEMALESFGDRPELYVSRARLLGALGSEREAAESLADAAMAAYRQGDPQQAAAFVEEILTLPRLSPRALLSFAAIFISAGMAAQGEHLLRETVRRMREENDLEGLHDALGQLARLRPGNQALRQEMDMVTRRLADQARRAARSVPPPVRKAAQRAGHVAPPPTPRDVRRPGREGLGENVPTREATEAPARKAPAAPSPADTQKLLPISLALFIFGGFAGLSGSAFLPALMGVGLLFIANQFRGSAEAFIQRMVLRGAAGLLLLLSLVVFFLSLVGIV